MGGPLPGPGMKRLTLGCFILEQPDNADGWRSGLDWQLGRRRANCGIARVFHSSPWQNLPLQSRVYGVRYPESALKALARPVSNMAAGCRTIGYQRSLRNFASPCISRAQTLCSNALPGIPTIRPFEALACGIPLISAPWQRLRTSLFRAGRFPLCAKWRRDDQATERSSRGCGKSCSNRLNGD